MSSIEVAVGIGILGVFVLGIAIGIGVCRLVRVVARGPALLPMGRCAGPGVPGRAAAARGLGPGRQAGAGVPVRRGRPSDAAGVPPVTSFGVVAGVAALFFAALGILDGRTGRAGTVRDARQPRTRDTAPVCHAPGREPRLGPATVASRS